MSLPLPPRERLLPALLDRLTDLEPGLATEAVQQRVMTRGQLRAAVLRDLGWLLNAVQPLLPQQQADHPLAATSVLNYGLPPISGQLASRIDITQVERELRSALIRFEPRLLEESLSVQAQEFSGALDTHNIIEFRIHALLWAQPEPLELLLRTELDLEAGQVRVHDLSAGSMSGAA